LTEEITAALSRVPRPENGRAQLGISLSKARRRHSENGEALHVSKLLEGSVRKVGKQIRVTAHFLTPADGFHLWSENTIATSRTLSRFRKTLQRRIARSAQGQTEIVSLPNDKLGIPSLQTLPTGPAILE